MNVELPDYENFYLKTEDEIGPILEINKEYLNVRLKTIGNYKFEVVTDKIIKIIKDDY